MFSVAVFCYPIGGAFLAELPFKAASAAWCRRTATNEGRPLLRTGFPLHCFFYCKTSKIVCLVSRLPLASSCLRTMRQKSSAFKAFPLSEKKFSELHFFGKNAKPCLTSRLPRGGKLSTSLTDEGRPLLRTGCFKQFSQKNSTVFIGSKKAPCFSQDAFHIKSLIPLYFPQSRRRFPSFLPRFPRAFLPSRTRRCSYRR